LVGTSLLVCSTLLAALAPQEEEGWQFNAASPRASGLGIRLDAEVGRRLDVEAPDKKLPVAIGSGEVANR
jgi:hypothetical protein